MIILFGVVGSGKSEQAKRLLARLNCPYISTSQLLRDNLTPARQKAMTAGKLVDDEDILSLLEPALKAAASGRQECILDGAPRSVAQAEWLDGKIKFGQVKLTAIIHLKVSRKVVLQRLRQRQREDDQEDIIKQRFEDYDKITSPVLDYLRRAGYRINDIDGEQSPDEVEAAIKQALEPKSAG